MHKILDPSWVNPKSITDIRVGDKIASSMNGDSDDIDIYFGKVYAIYPYSSNKYTIDIKRDDGQHGGGTDSTWTTVYSDSRKNRYFIQRLEWDE